MEKIGSLIVYSSFISWVFGIVFLMISNASLIISKVGYERSGWRKYRMGYSIREINEVIQIVDDVSIKSRLRRKIRLRRIARTMMLLTPVLYVIGFAVS